MPTEASDAERDPEFAAITAIVRALEPLNEEARSRVLDYSLRRLGLKVSAPAQEPTTVVGEPIGGPEPAGRTATVHDIRTLREQKSPKTAIEMAAVVGYYLAHLAPQAERKSEIAAADITKYFHDANYPLPGAPSMTLVNARNAGYFDQGSGKGNYRLNPVGHNLVAHRLPAATTTGRQARTRPSVKTSARRRSVRAAKRATAKPGSRKGKLH